MVQEAVSDTESTEVPEGDEVAEVVETEAVESPEGAEETETTEPDLLAELTAEVAALRLSAVTKDELQPLQSGVGRIDSMQSRLAELAEQNPLATVDPRIAGLESALVAILDGQIADPATDDARRASLVQTRQQLDAAGRQRDIDSAVDKAVGERLPEATEQTAEAPDTQRAAVLQEMSTRLRGYAEAKSVDYDSLTPSVLNFQPGESLDAAFTRVKGHIDGLSEEVGATERVTARAAAAGGGTPARSGGASSDDDLRIKLQERGVKSLSEAERVRVAALLDVPLQV